MIRPLGLFALAAAFAAAPAAAQDLKGPQWKPLSFYVQRPDPDAPDAKAPRDRDRGTRVAARLELPGNTVVALNSKNCKLDSFTDDKGTDLTAGPAGPLRPQPIS